MAMTDTGPTNKTVLLVEDYEDSRDLMGRMLEFEGLRVVEAADGLEAVRLAGEAGPDLIVMDLRMPVLDGIEAIRLIRRSESLRDVPVIIVSGDGELTREVFFDLEELGSGRIEFLMKPIEAEQFLSLVRDALSGGRKDPRQEPSSP